MVLGILPLFSCQSYSRGKGKMGIRVGGGGFGEGVDCMGLEEDERSRRG